MFKIAAMALTTASLATPARAAEIKVFAMQSAQIVMGGLAGDFEHRTGDKIVQLSKTTELPLATKARIDAGESFDVVCLTAPVIDQLIRDGKLVAGTRKNFMRIPIGVAVRSGAPRPDISSVEAFRRTLLSAKSIAYAPPTSRNLHTSQSTVRHLSLHPANVRNGWKPDTGGYVRNSEDRGALSLV